MFYLFLFFSLLVGLIMGSFLNCFLWRVHENESLWNRSYCPKCRRKINWHDNVPVLSFALLRGRCRHCRLPISWQYPLVESAMGLLFALAFFLNWPGGSPETGLLFFDSNFITLTLVRDWFVIFVAAAIFVYDWRWFLIPDIIVLPAIVIVFFLNFFLGGDPLVMIWPLLLGGGFFLIQFLFSRGRWIGGGDIRFGAFMGAALGRLDVLVLAMMLSYWLGAAVGIFLLIKKKKNWKSQIPFGIFLAVGTLLALFFGEEMLAWYFSLL